MIRLDLDYKIQRVKGYAAQIFVIKIILIRLNGLIVTKIGIISSGKSYNDVREALRWLNIDKQKAADLGICLYKVGILGH